MKRLMNLALTMTMLSGLNLQAATQAELEKRAERETQWSKVKAELPGAKGQSTFVKTDQGNLRLLELGQSMSVGMKLAGSHGVLKYATSPSKVEKACERLRATLEYELEQDNTFSGEILANPLNAAALKDGIVDSNSWVGSKLALETKIHQVRVEPALSYATGGRPLTSVKRLRDFQNELLHAFQTSEQSIQSGGEVQFKLAKADDLICDLLMGHVEMKVQLVATFDAAILRRMEVLSSSDIRQMQDDLKRMPVSEGGTMIKNLAHAANLGIVLHQKLGSKFESFMQEKFEKLVPGIINTADASLVQSSDTAATRLARKLDDLGEARDTNQTIISVKAEWSK
ncbi:MAG: hypothetical protein AB7F86_08130 [Bdellovibrionales bacterium]